jgi:hypothetical protein
MLRSHRVRGAGDDAVPRHAGLELTTVSRVEPHDATAVAEARDPELRRVAPVARGPLGHRVEIGHDLLVGDLSRDRARLVEGGHLGHVPLAGVELRGEMSIGGVRL